jgi:hypothetical protein
VIGVQLPTDETPAVGVHHDRQDGGTRRPVSPNPELLTRRTGMANEATSTPARSTAPARAALILLSLRRSSLSVSWSNCRTSRPAATRRNSGSSRPR